MGSARGRWMVLMLVAGLGFTGGLTGECATSFAKGRVDVVTTIRTADKRRPVSPLIYGLNVSSTIGGQPAELMRAVTFVRRGGDRANAYNWETNVSSGAQETGFGNDMYLAAGLADQNAPAAVDLDLIGKNRAAGRSSMVPFVLNDYVAGPVAGDIPWDTSGFDHEQYFRRVRLVKPAPFATSPDLNDGIAYTDEHFAFLRGRFPSTDIYAPGPKQVLVGIDNEPDLWHLNFPMLQAGRGAPIYADNGVQVGTRVLGDEFTERFIKLARRIKTLAPRATIVGPSHYEYDGFTSWHGSMPQYSDPGRWYMDDFLAETRKASKAIGQRLLDTWDFHWYPQRVMRGKFVWNLDDSVRPLTQAEISAIVQGPRSYWDKDFDEQSWITKDHTHGPAYILTRLQRRIAKDYPGTKLGVSEYFPGGCGHIASGLAVADSLGVFARMGVHLAALWPACRRLEFAFGGIELFRNADGKGLRFADTVVKVEHPEKVKSSVYAGSDNDGKRVTVVVINKTNATRKFGLRIFHRRKLTKVAIHRIDAAHATPRFVRDSRLRKKNAFAYKAPALSAALLVFTAR